MKKINILIGSLVTALAMIPIFGATRQADAEALTGSAKYGSSVTINGAFYADNSYTEDKRICQFTEKLTLASTLAFVINTSSNLVLYNGTTVTQTPSYSKVTFKATYDYSEASYDYIFSNDEYAKVLSISNNSVVPIWRQAQFPINVTLESVSVEKTGNVSASNCFYAYLPTSGDYSSTTYNQSPSYIASCAKTKDGSSISGNYVYFKYNVAFSDSIPRYDESASSFGEVVYSSPTSQDAIDDFDDWKTDKTTETDFSELFAYMETYYQNKYASSGTNPGTSTPAKTNDNTFQAKWNNMVSQINSNKDKVVIVGSSVVLLGIGIAVILFIKNRKH